MKLISWNCQGAFRKKNKKVLSFKPDILVIPECENEKKLRFGELTPQPNDFFWYGNDLNKGIGVFSYSDYKFELLKEFNPKFKFIIPLKVTNNKTSFILFAVWANNKQEDDYNRYIRQVWFSINYYKHLLDYPVILIGDFNSNKVWDKKGRIGNHSDVANKLKEKEIISLYHLQNKLKQGEETTPTFFMYRKKEKPYHIDYCFASRSLLGNGFDILIENYNKWNKLSDHSPLIINLKVNVYFERFENKLELRLKEMFQKLNPITQQKFYDLIDSILTRGKKIDMKNRLKEENKEYIKLLKDTENLIKINQLIEKVNCKN